MFRVLVLGAAILGFAASTQASYEPTLPLYSPSKLGTLEQPNLPHYLRQGSERAGRWGRYSDAPWKGSHYTPRNPPPDPPSYGTTRRYDFTVSRAIGAPDGVQKKMMVINNQFPGPLIEANWGDWIEVHVTNNITGPEDGTTIHWHGLLQKNTPEMDGVPSVTQCPIAPGKTHIYRFQATVYGTSWYHSHESAQYIDGAFGPIVIYGPSHVPYDKDMGVVMVQDWYHKNSVDLMSELLGNNTALQTQNVSNTLINGKNSFDCSKVEPGMNCTPNAPHSQFRVQTGKTYKIHLINTGAGDIYYFSIDNHNLTIISNDFVDTEPYQTELVTLGTGQRAEVLFTPHGTGAVWMRAFVSGLFCGVARNIQPSAQAVVFLDDAPASTVPSTTAFTAPVDDNTCKDDPLSKTKPYYAQTPPSPSITFNITINQEFNATGHKLFYMNGVSMKGDYSSPILAFAQHRNYTHFDPAWNVVNFGAATSIRLNIWNNNTNPHPMHLHGHEFWVLAEGNGTWDGVSITDPLNPQRRDTQNLWPNGYTVIQYDANNPGAWIFHCHIASHVSGGLAMTLIERPNEIPTNAAGQVADTCREWEAWSKGKVVDEIDSGV